jgi:transposase-like protein
MEQKQQEYAKVIRCMKAGKSIRDTAKICGVSVSTCQRVKKNFGL